MQLRGRAIMSVMITARSLLAPVVVAAGLVLVHCSDGSGSDGTSAADGGSSGTSDASGTSGTSGTHADAGPSDSGGRDDAAEAGDAAKTLLLRVFVSAATMSPLFGGITGGDAKCTSLAHDAGLGGQWVAWLSSDTVDAKSRLPVNATYYLVGGSVSVATTTELVTDHPHAPIDRDESGLIVGGMNWTGSSVGGNRASGSTCSNWTNVSSVAMAQGGLVGAADGRWTDDGAFPCNQPLHLMCFQETQ